jgi:hypothetical protein
MKPEEQPVHSFVIRVWQEELDGDGSVGWRGHITHVPSEERIYLKELGEVLDFVVPYLKTMGVKDVRGPCGSKSSGE